MLNSKFTLKDFHLVLLFRIKWEAPVPIVAMTPAAKKWLVSTASPVVIVAVSGCNRRSDLSKAWSLWAAHSLLHVPSENSWAQKKTYPVEFLVPIRVSFLHSTGDSDRSPKVGFMSLWCCIPTDIKSDFLPKRFFVKLSWKGAPLKQQKHLRYHLRFKPVSQLNAKKRCIFRRRDWKQSGLCALQRVSLSSLQTFSSRITQT